MSRKGVIRGRDPEVFDFLIPIYLRLSLSAFIFICVYLYLRLSLSAFICEKRSNYSRFFLRIPQPRSHPVKFS